MENHIYYRAIWSFVHFRLSSGWRMRWSSCCCRCP